MRARRFALALALGPLLLLPLGLGGARLARGKPAAKPAEPAESFVDIATVKDKLEILTDGKSHYVALIPFDDGGWAHVYYGDGKAFHALRVIGSGSVGRESFDLTYWEPRVKARYQAGLEFKGGKYEVLCDTRKTELHALPRAEADALIANATFHKPLWRFRACARARDDNRTNYNVDPQREPEG